VLEFTSLHDPSVGSDYPELAHDDLLAQMVVVDTAGRARGGADAVRYLSRRLPFLWPLAVPLHVPGTLPLWAALYRFVARNRMRIAGSCEDGTCKLPQ
jgi:predicted DCC family thiol-disulfide oxidoreductase YuxK